ECRDVGLRGVIEERAVSFGGNLEDLSTLTGPDQEVPRSVLGERPDVALVRLEEDGRLAPRPELVDRAVRRSACIDRPTRRGEDRGHFGLFELGNGGGLTFRGD